MSNLQVGVLNWQALGGKGEFYPEDMPVEWQLDYYSNAFRVVLVPEGQWVAWDAEALETCVEGVEGEFGFYLRVDETLTEEKAQKIQFILEGLGDLLHGILVFSEMQAPPISVHGLPVSLLSKRPATELSLKGWSGQVGEYYVSGHPVGYYETLTSDGKQQAALLRDFMKQVPEKSLNSSSVAFFIGGESINMNHIANLKMVGEFLGY